MRLRNKETGEIVEFKIIQTNCECLAEHEAVTMFGEELSLETLSKYFEDYTAPAEPLIKDEKVRKAVRAWAEANNIDKVDHWQGVLTGRKAGCQRGRAKIQFNEALGFGYGCDLDIAELCGEEEE